MQTQQQAKTPDVTPAPTQSNQQPETPFNLETRNRFHALTDNSGDVFTGN